MPDITFEQFLYELLKDLRLSNKKQRLLSQKGWRRRLKLYER